MNQFGFRFNLKKYEPIQIKSDRIWWKNGPARASLLHCRPIPLWNSSVAMLGLAGLCGARATLLPKWISCSPRRSFDHHPKIPWISWQIVGFCPLSLIYFSFICSWDWTFESCIDLSWLLQKLSPHAIENQGWLLPLYWMGDSMNVSTSWLWFVPVLWRSIELQTSATQILR